mmetsp:Transcript_36412/g.87828  ORF Transcript_36412/g.87828 Transcript_36412/m.87828 type:complete len:209 (+) Transcript_36412:269-895(+)
MLLVLGLKLVRHVRIRKPQGEHLLLELPVREVVTAPHPAPVAPRVGLELYARIEGVVGDDLHGLLLAHEETEALVLAVTEDSCLADAALLPRFFARALVEEGLAVEEEFGAEFAEGLLLLLAGFDVDLLQFYHRLEGGRALLLLGTVLLLLFGFGCCFRFLLLGLFNGLGFGLGSLFRLRLLFRHDALEVLFMRRQGGIRMAGDINIF